MTTQHAKSNAREGDGVAVTDAMVQRFEDAYFERIDAHLRLHGSLGMPTRRQFIKEALAAALQAQQGAEPVAWIPVGERLPDECGWYHCTVEGVGDLGPARWQEIVSLGHYADYGKRFATAGGAQVTHWKSLGPLPAPGAPR